MGSFPGMRALLGGVLYVLLAGVILVAGLTPLSHTPDTLPAPDLVLCLTLAWMYRRPDLLPFWAVGAVALLGDLLLGRPPGLWAALMIVGTEYLRWRNPSQSGLTFPAEFVGCAAVAVALVLANRLLLSVFVVPQPPLGTVLAQVPITLAAYPVVVLVLVHVFGIRRLSESARNAMRQA